MTATILHSGHTSASCSGVLAWAVGGKRVVVQLASSAPKASAESTKSSALASAFDRDPDAKPLVNRSGLVFITGGSDGSCKSGFKRVMFSQSAQPCPQDSCARSSAAL